MIKQARIASAISFFRKDFLGHWNLSEYRSNNVPTIFLGAYKMVDVEAINNHKGFKVVLLAGADRRNINLINPDNAVFRSDPTFTRWVKENATNDLRLKEVDIAIKSYQMFQPSPLGDAVYCYMGKSMESEKFKHEQIKEVAAKSRFPFIYGIHPNPMTTMIDQYYKRSFVNLKLNPFAGHTTSLELAHMGRRSICNRDESWFLKYESIDDIVKLIEQESTRIGTIQPSQVPDDYFAGEEWKQVEFWLT